MDPKPPRARPCTSGGESSANDDPNVATFCEGNLLPDDTRGICVAPAKRGEPCLAGPDWGDTCEVGSTCDRQGTRRCVEPVPIGGACEELEQCEGLACADGICREPLAFIISCEP